MMKFACENAVTQVDELKDFDLEGYYFVEKLSNEQNFVFRRDNNLF